MSTFKKGESKSLNNRIYTRGNGGNVKVTGNNTSTRTETLHRANLRFNQGK